jgi:redox-sensitive bicupin YhaK (pirin superfamily)
MKVASKLLQLLYVLALVPIILSSCGVGRLIPIVAAFRAAPTTTTTSSSTPLSSATTTSTTTRLAMMTSSSRLIDKVVSATDNGKIVRLIGTVDMAGQGTQHPLAEVDPFILLDSGTITKNSMPPFGAHPHRGHSVVTVLTQGKISSWDSFKPTTAPRETLTAPASYWVDAGTGVFHDERSVIDDEDDPSQHMHLYQLWVGVKQVDRTQSPQTQYDNNLPVFDCKDPTNNDRVVGKGIYHVGPETSITTPHPIVVAQIHQDPNTIYQVPIEPSHNGFVVHRRGQQVSYAGTIPTADEDVLVLGPADAGTSTSTTFLQVETKDSPADYLVCTGEPHGEQWVKLLVANGAIIAATPEEAQELAPKVEAMAKAGKMSGGSFAPFGMEREY